MLLLMEAGGKDTNEVLLFMIDAVKQGQSHKRGYGKAASLQYLACLVLVTVVLLAKL